MGDVNDLCCLRKVSVREGERHRDTVSILQVRSYFFFFWHRCKTTKKG